MRFSGASCLADPELVEIADLTPTDGGFIVGNGSDFVLETGDTARTSLGLGTGDSPSFTALSIPLDGSALATDGAITLGAGNDAGMYFDGSDLTLHGGLSFRIKTSGPVQTVISSGGIDIPVGGSFNQNTVSLLSGTTLGTPVVNSSLTSVGTLTSLTVAGDVIVDTNTLFVDASEDAVGINTTSITSGISLDLIGELRVQRAGGASQYIDTTLDGTGNAVNFNCLESNKKDVIFNNTHDAGGSPSGSQDFIFNIQSVEHFRIDQLGVVSVSGADFKVDTDTLFVDESEAKVGIGTSGPIKDLHVLGATGTGIQIDGASTYGFQIRSVSAGSDTLNIQSVNRGTDTVNTADILNIRRNGTIGINIASNSVAATLDITQPSATGAIPVLELDQDDTSEPFINFVGTETADANSSLSSLTTSGATTGHVQIDYNGAKAWIAVSTNAPT